MRRGIIAGSSVVLALAGCSAAPVPQPSTAGTGPRVFGPSPQETAYTRGIIQHDEWLATHQGEAPPAPAGQPEGEPPCGLLMMDVPDGLALVFSAREGESVDALRKRVREIASRYNDRDPDARKLTQDLMHMKHQVSALASEQSVPGGARLVLSTAHRDEVQALRALMRWHAADLMPGISAEVGRQGPCPSLPKPVFG
jgi:hypothetical protein